MSRVTQQDMLLNRDAKEVIVGPWFEVFCKVYHVTAHSEVWMDNHFHIELTMHKPAYDYEDVKQRYELLAAHLSRPRKWHPARAKSFFKRITDLSCFMRDFKWRIAWECNRINDKRGHFWDARFKSLEVKGAHHENVVSTYIQQNPVRAKMVDKPSEYPYCTTGKIKAALDRGEDIQAPQIGLFARIRDNLSRCRAYVAYQDWMAYLIKNPQARQQLAPPEVIALSIPSESWKETCQELRERRPTNWSKQIYTYEPKEEGSQQITPPP